jgi:hypothetical protein
VPEIPAFVISLPDCHDRRQNIASELTAAGIPFSFFDAIDGRTSPLGDYFDGARIDRARFNNEAAVANMLSHRAIHRLMLERLIPQALIFEDDAKLSSNFSAILENALKFQCDFFKLEGLGEHACPGITISSIGDYRVVARGKPSYGSAAYLIRLSGARKLCALDVIDRPPDVIYRDPRAGLLQYEIEPFLARQDRCTYPSTICPSGQRRSQFSLFAQVHRALRRRWYLIRIYGPLMAMKMELDYQFNSRRRRPSSVSQSIGKQGLDARTESTFQA